MTTQNNNNDLNFSYEAPPEMAPEGRQALLCVDVFETWPEEETWNNETSTKRKIMFVFQVFTEDGARDTEGDVFRLEHKVNASFTPPSANFSASGLWKLVESWTGQPLSRKSASFNPEDFIGRAAWGSLEQKTRYTKLSAIEPYLDDDGNPLPPLTAEPYKRRNYPNPETWKSKQAQAGASQPNSPGGPPNEGIVDNRIPF